MYIPEPCELAYGTTLLLSSAGTSIGTVYTSRDSTGVYHWSMTSSLLYSTLFIAIQVNEFNVLGVYTSDSYTGCTYVYTSGLHFIHVTLGVMLVGVNSVPVYTREYTPTDTVPMDLYLTMDYCY